MEDAGERWDDPDVRNTGVFVGLFIHDYQHMQFADRDQLSAHSGTGTSMGSPPTGYPIVWVKI